MRPLLSPVAHADQALLGRVERSREGVSFINDTANNTVSGDVNAAVSTQVSVGAAMEVEGRGGGRWAMELEGGKREEGEGDGRNGGARYRGERKREGRSSASHCLLGDIRPVLAGLPTLPLHVHRAALPSASSSCF